MNQNQSEDSPYFILREGGVKYDVSEYIPIFHDNIKNGYKIFDRTPICEKADGSYFWWADINIFYDLDSKSLEDLVEKAICGLT